MLTPRMYLGLFLLYWTPVLANPTNFRDTCDASAVNRLPSGLLIIADDESNVIRAYTPDGQPTAQFHFGAYLGDNEADIEGTARVGNFIYWVTSHGRNRKGKRRWARHQLFSAQWSDTAAGLNLRFEGRFTDLATAMVRPERWRDPDRHKDVIERLREATQLEAKTVRRLAPKAQGLNIEALTTTPDGQLLLGLRNPLLSGRAIILKLGNPDIALGGGVPIFTNAYTVDLGRRGLRAMARRGERYLLLAGPIDAETGFMLYQWRGQTGREPVKVQPIPSAPGVNPEGLAVGPNTLVFVNDEGSRKVNGRRCKDLPPEMRSFSSFRLALPREPTHKSTPPAPAPRPKTINKRGE